MHTSGEADMPVLKTGRIYPEHIKFISNPDATYFLSSIWQVTVLVSDMELSY
jgi:hypothetical protein